MQPIAAGDQYAAYQARLRSSHDFGVEVDILSLDEELTGSATLLDGQVNLLASGDDPIRREATLTLSDPAGALDFSDSSAWSGTSLWVTKLVRIRHIVDVPGYGEMTAVVFIGPPTGISRQGAEVQAVCRDKGALATRGARPLTVNKGANAVKAIEQIFRQCTGEFRFRLPANARKLSKPYSVGLSDDASPFTIATKIASHELGKQLLYSCDGYLMLREKPSTSAPVADMGYVTDQASTSADFTTLSNWVRVSGKVKSKHNVSTHPETIQTLPDSNSISPHAIRRQGVERLLPLVIDEPAYTTTTQTAKRAKSALTAAAGLDEEIAASVIPMFHLDSDDVVTIHVSATEHRTTRLTEASIPLGVGGDMTIGYPRQVSAIALAKAKSRKVRVKKKRHK